MAGGTLYARCARAFGVVTQRAHGARHGADQSPTRAAHASADRGHHAIWTGDATLREGFVKCVRLTRATCGRGVAHRADGRSRCASARAEVGVAHARGPEVERTRRALLVQALQRIIDRLRTGRIRVQGAGGTPRNRAVRAHIDILAGRAMARRHCAVHLRPDPIHVPTSRACAGSMRLNHSSARQARDAQRQRAAYPPHAEVVAGDTQASIRRGLAHG